MEAMTLRKLTVLAFLALIPVALTGNGSELDAAQQQQQKPGANSPHGQGMSGMDHGMSGMDHDMPGMDMTQGDDGDHSAEKGAVSAMSHDAMGHHHHQMGPHMYMTSLRPATPQEWAKADAIVDQLREGIDKYKDYRVALADGYHIFLPNLPLPEYHFTNYWNGFLESFSFDPARPTSLLYKKTKTGYDLVGAMYTMPKRVTEEQLNARIPLSVAQWHLHTKLCMPPKGEGKNADWKKFGLQGSILSKDACLEAGGTFYPVIFGWMVHIYPFEDSREKIWAQ
jgi:hypothetical protein